MYGTPATVIQSGVFTLVARTRMRTSSSPTGGGSIHEGSLPPKLYGPYEQNVPK
jgi:hypothetical protein